MRWIEIFASILKRQNLNVEGMSNWDGDDNNILVNGMPLWDYIKENGLTKSELLRDNIFLITIMFDERVKSMIKNILMKKGKDKVPIA